MLVFGIFIILIGAITASKFLSEKLTFLQRVFQVLEPVKGWLGFFALSWGVFSIIFSFSWPTTSGRVTLLLDGIIELLVGFILGFTLISRYFLAEKEDVEHKALVLLNKLKPFSTVLGLIAMAMGLWTMIYPFIFSKSLYSL